ncbi:hypothetical protein LL912_04675 [Niabella sp. CC-SYL272]|uniref:hypothetical protein n=1 Tax=Niabella agricola TaxID=2891571 RepID=UPI001F17A2A5|nr:hypothetical protein [Niabella agricola]MCF3108066.1 hypothetical protein [Niabella agricola]
MPRRDSSAAAGMTGIMTWVPTGPAPVGSERREYGTAVLKKKHLQHVQVTFLL